MSETESQLFVSKQQLEGTIRRKLAAAVKARDDASVLRILEAASVLDFQDGGLRILVDHLREVVALETQEDLELVKELVAQGVGIAVDFATVLDQLLRRVMRSIDDNMKLLCNISGQDAVLYAIKELHRECDSLGPVILEKFFEVRELSKLEKEIAGWRKNVASTENTEKPDPQEVAYCLDEMEALLQAGEDSLAFTVTMVERARFAGVRLSPGDGLAIQFGPFKKAVQKLSGIYVILEEFTLKETVRKAIERNKIGPGKYESKGPRSSMVDDILPVLQSSSRRAVSTGNVHAMSVTLKLVGSILNNEYKNALLGKTLEGNLDEKLFEAECPVMQMGSEVAALLNNVEISAVDASYLWDEVHVECLHLFIPNPSEKPNLRASVAELKKACSNLTEMSKLSLQQVANVFIPRILNRLGTASDELSRTQGAEDWASNPWVQEFFRVVSENVAWLRPLLSQLNFDSVIQFIIAGSLSRLASNKQQEDGQLESDSDSDAHTPICKVSEAILRAVQVTFFGDTNRDPSEFEILFSDALGRELQFDYMATVSTGVRIS